ncbi:MAG: VanZ family protein [Thermodesulfovibrionales bacterium]
MNSKKCYILSSLSILYMILIFYLSSLSRPIEYELPFGTDKVLHLIEYAILGFIVSWSLREWGIRSYSVIAWSIATVYGLSDEIHQSFVPGREASLADFLSDFTGGFIGVRLQQMMYNITASISGKDNNVRKTQKA